MTPRKIEWKRKRESGFKIFLVEIHRNGGTTFARIERKTPVLTPTFQQDHSFLCGLRSSSCKREELDGRAFCTKRAPNRGKKRSSAIINKNEHNGPKNKSLRTTWANWKRVTLAILTSLASAPVTKEKLSPPNKGKRPAEINL